MGVPRLEPAEIPFIAPQRALTYPWPLVNVKLKLVPSVWVILMP
jgi:hypothetical protein